MKKYIFLLLALLLSLSACGTALTETSEKALSSSGETVQEEEEKTYTGIIDEYVESADGQYWITTPLTDEGRKVRLEFSRFAEEILLTDDVQVLFKREAPKSQVTVTYKGTMEEDNTVILKEVTGLKTDIYDHYGNAGITDPDVICVYRNSYGYLELELDDPPVSGITLEAEAGEDGDGNAVIYWTVRNQLEKTVQCGDVLPAVTDPVLGGGSWRALGVLPSVYDTEQQEETAYEFSSDDTSGLAPGETLSGTYVANGRIPEMPIRAVLPVFIDGTLHFVYTDIPADAF